MKTGSMTCDKCGGTLVQPFSKDAGRCKGCRDEYGEPGKATVSETSFQRFHRKAMEISSGLGLRGESRLTGEQTTTVAQALQAVEREALERAAKVADKMYVGDGTNESYVYSGNVGTEILRLRLALIGDTES